MFNFAALFFLFHCVLSGDLKFGRCKSSLTQWKVNSTTFMALPFRGTVYAYPLCNNVKSSVASAAKVRCIDGRWEKPLPLCERIITQTCEPLPLLTNGLRSCEDGAPSVGKSCTFECTEGFTLVGSLRRTCQRDLQWTGATPECIDERVVSSLKCRLLPSIANGQINCDERAPALGTSCYFTCNKGYKLIGPSNRTCNSYFRWTGSISQCIIDDVSSQMCRNLSSIENGKINCDERAPALGTSCYFTCNKGYKLTGPSNRKCHSNFRWTGKKSECTIDDATKNTSPSISHLNNKRKQPEVQNNSRNQSSTNPCENNNGDCDHLCDYQSGFVTCSCKPGYFSEDGKNCKDFDECSNARYYCHQKCINTQGSYYCICNEGFISKDKYYCEDIDECLQGQHHCQQQCTNTRGSYKCLCKEGFTLRDKYFCEDIDECQHSNQNHCSQRCKNTIGGYHCSCEPGFILKNDYICEGCRKNSYRSEADISCEECPPNSYTDSEAKVSIADCKCNTGFSGDPSSSIPCEDINECFSNILNCSHGCVNTPGDAHCSCPPGFKLENNNRTCVDIDECGTKNGGCQMLCQNTIGSFSCSCSKGYSLSNDNFSCNDINECEIGNGNCSDICNNSPGGFYCSCPENRHLSAGGKICTGVRCPFIAVPHHLYLDCKFIENSKHIFRKLKANEANPPSDFPTHTNCRLKCDKGYDLSTRERSISCREDGTWNASIPECLASQCPPLNITENVIVHPEKCNGNSVPVKQQCYFTCQPGYTIVGAYRILKCKNNLTWSYEAPSCKLIETAVPFVNCPDDVTVNLTWNENRANITIARPISNVEVMEIVPDWVEVEKAISFPSGKTEVVFKVLKSDSNSTAQCIVTVTVLDKQPPVFYDCPESFEVNNVGSQGAVVTWDEPVAVDNVDVKIMATNLEPNSTLIPGIHFVEYVVEDAAGNKENCSFQINVTRGYCGHLMDPDNGIANCMDWFLGKLCRPYCIIGYERDKEEPKFFACGDTGEWTPSDLISPCLSKCENGTTWSITSDTCEDS